MKTRIIISAATIALLSFAGTAFAQSTVTGTLSGGASSSSSGSSTLSGTVTPGAGSGTLTGTVTAPGTTGGGSTGGGGGGGGGTGSGSNVVDICPNIAGIQATLSGYVLQNGNCIVSTAGTGGGGGVVTPTGGTGGGGAVLGTSTGAPGIPNTGAGGNAGENLITLTLSALAGLGALLYLRKTRLA